MGRKANNGKQTFRDICVEIGSSINSSKQQKLPEYYIITEGQTEKWYLKHLKETGKIYFSFPEPKSVDGGDYLDKIDKEIGKISAIPRKKIICIFDVDRFRDSQSEFDKFSEFKAKYNNVNVFNNMPSIEYWFLLHYSNNIITKYFSKDGLWDVLKQKDPFRQASEKVIKSEIFLKPDTWFKTLCGKGYQNLDNAIKSARSNHDITLQQRMDVVATPTACNVSYSDMYKLFDINKPKQEKKN